MKVLISGAGIAGSTLAYLLGKSNVPCTCTVIEASQSTLTQGHNIDLDEPAIEIMDRLGFLPAILERNTTEIGLRAEREDGSVVAWFPMVKDSRRSPTSQFEILRGDFAALLHQRASQLPGVEYVLGEKIQEVVSHSEESVSVRLTNGSVHTADVLILADGQWSKLRKTLFPSDSIQLRELGVYSIYGTISKVPTDLPLWRALTTTGGRFISLRPDPHGTHRAFLSIRTTNDNDKEEFRQIFASKCPLEERRAWLHRRFSDVGWETPRILQGFDSSTDLYFSPLVQVIMKQWYDGRIVCVGDAAYCPTPLSGMGTTAAVTGAYILAGELVNLSRRQQEQQQQQQQHSSLPSPDLPSQPPSPLHPREAFQSYQSIYQPETLKIQDVSTTVIKWFLPNSRFAVWVTRAILWIGARLIGSGGSGGFTPSTTRFRGDEKISKQAREEVEAYRSRKDKDKEKRKEGFVLPEYDFDFGIE